MQDDRSNNFLEYQSCYVGGVKDVRLSISIISEARLKSKAGGNFLIENWRHSKSIRLSSNGNARITQKI